VQDQHRHGSKREMRWPGQWEGVREGAEKSAEPPREEAAVGKSLCPCLPSEQGRVLTSGQNCHYGSSSEKESFPYSVHRFVIFLSHSRSF